MQTPSRVSTRSHPFLPLRRQDLHPTRFQPAKVSAQARFTGAAQAGFERLLAGPSKWVSGPMLRIDPRGDPIRRDPRFQALVRRYGG
jgi:hypothetical protein